MNYYRSIITAKVLPEPYAKAVNDIYGGNHLDYLVRCGVLEKMPKIYCDAMEHLVCMGGRKFVRQKDGTLVPLLEIMEETERELEAGRKRKDGLDDQI